MRWRVSPDSLEFHEWRAAWQQAQGLVRPLHALWATLAERGEKVFASLPPCNSYVQPVTCNL